MTLIEELLQGMIRARVLEDRREYLPSDLERAYALTKQEAIELYHMIQDLFK